MNEVARQALYNLPLRTTNSCGVVRGLAQVRQGEEQATAFITLLRTCASNKDYCRGSRTHNDILRRGLLKECLDALVTMYAKCGALAQATNLFDMHESRDLLTWTALISGYTQNGEGQKALELFEQMQWVGLSPDAVTFSCILKACGIMGATEEGEKIYDDIVRQGLLENDVVLGTALVDMYVKCGALLKAQRVLQELPICDVGSWNALIAGYAQQGREEQAVNCLELMQCSGIHPDAFTFACILKACGSLRAPDKGQRIHDTIVRQGFLDNSIALGNALIDMYSKCGYLSRAQHVLQDLPVRDVISWSAMISGYSQQAQGEQALNCFKQMQLEGLSPNEVTFACVVKACGSIGSANKGEQIHDEIVKLGLLKENIVLGTALVDMYAKCGALSKAQKLLEELACRDAVSWAALIASCTKAGQFEQALHCFECMQNEGLSPDVVTLSYALRACGNIQAAGKGEEIHNQVSMLGLLKSNVVLGKAVADMYLKCGLLLKAQDVLEGLPVHDDVIISWSALIGKYIEEGQDELALDCFEWMFHRGVSPDALTFTCILKACSTTGAAEKGAKVHHEIERRGLLKDNVILGSALVDMYAKCGVLSKAQQVFDELPCRDAVSWNALIAGYSQQGHSELAVDCFKQMQLAGFTPNVVTFTCILKTCGEIGASGKGEELHDTIVRQGLLGKDVLLGTALVDMYAKCGALSKAQQVLDKLHVKDVVSWSALLVGYAQQGHVHKALTCLDRMQGEGLCLDAAVFSCLLTACSHGGLAEDAQTYWVVMRTKYEMRPNLEHYTCMVDVFGRAGHLDKAVAVIEEMPSSTSAVWCSLLGACRKWGDAVVGRWAFELAIQVDKRDAAFYALMADIYAATGMQKDAESIDALRLQNKAWRHHQIICEMV